MSWSLLAWCAARRVLMAARPVDEHVAVNVGGFANQAVGTESCALTRDGGRWTFVSRRASFSALTGDWPALIGR
jgi:hypothetical protein